MRYLTIICLLVFAIGCKKDDIPTFEGRDGISFYNTFYLNSDSINYSFALQPELKTRDTVFIKMRLVGKPANIARGIKLKALAGSTARPNVDYLLPEIKLPANEIFVNYPLVVLNSPEMDKQTFQLLLGVDPQSELVPGAPGVAVGLSSNLPVMKVNMTGQLIKPDYWQNIVFLFGDFSRVRFQFMVKVTGLTNFSPNVVDLGEIFRLQVKLKKALADYVQANGPLIDEFGKQVTF
ncbi:DUF4843 domain-containing protein [Pedobacter suwonensis]|uniref:DUF4843 domain-containing protein n=1 Tax=Pedobacter suwonensis TaxID=332999 RepID=UPI00119EBB52|nr:DUF4843 domain-containing protein [Pedobacter suwonensis]